MINVALVGVGNNASAVVQGVEYYRRTDNSPIGILNEISEYLIGDIHFALGIDVNAEKIGLDLSEAIFVKPNCSNILYKPPSLGVQVLRGKVLDGIDSKIAEYIPINEKQKPVNFYKELISNKIDVVVLMLPTGAQKASEYYSKQAIKAGCVLVNGTPASIANNPKIVSLSKKFKVPIIGDDIKSQVGATIIHRLLAGLFPFRGAVLDRTIQLDWGGGMDFVNLTSNNRYDAGKRQSKTESVISMLPNKDTVDVRISAVDHIPFLGASKEAYIRLEGRIFGGQPVRIDLMMQVEDNFDAAGIIVDAIRVGMIAKKRSICGVLDAASAFFMKRPPFQISDENAKQELIEFLKPPNR